MSTRCTIHFCYGSMEETEAIIYRHCDGYPEAMLPDLDRFFSDVENQTKDTRFSDPSYLAAKFVVWQSRENIEAYEGYEMHVGGPLDFLGLGICMEDPGDIEYRYHVVCMDNNRPRVHWE